MTYLALYPLECAQFYLWLVRGIGAVTLWWAMAFTSFCGREGGLDAFGIGENLAEMRGAQRPK